MKNICLLILLSIVNGDDLHFVVVFARHGARAPVSSIPDLDKRTSWPMGFGELTPSGQRQHYLLGNLLRKNYIMKEHLLPARYNPDSVTFKSTYFHRTIMTAESIAMGLYPANSTRLTKKQLKNDKIWIPPVKLDIQKNMIESLNYSGLPFDTPAISVESIMSLKDRLLNFNSCPLYEKYRNTYYNSKRFDEVYKKYRGDFITACNTLAIPYTGVKNKTFVRYSEYIVAAEYDGQLPEITKVKGLSDRLLAFCTESMIGELTVHPSMQSIALYEFSKTIPELFMNSTKSGQRMVVYATHDSTLLAYLIALGIDKKEYELVPFASNIILEMRGKENEYYVRVLYNGKLVMSEKLDAFFKRIREIGDIKGKWEDVCGIKERETISTTNMAMIPPILIICLFLGIRQGFIRKRDSKLVEV